MAAETIAKALGGRKARSGWIARCPAHDDRKPSFFSELERQQGRAFSEKEKAIFRKRGEHRFKIPDGSRWGDVKALPPTSVKY